YHLRPPRILTPAVASKFNDFNRYFSGSTQICGNRTAVRSTSKTTVFPVHVIIGTVCRTR
ncbi:MAG: hypothetical protein ACE1Y1_04450, partial [Nitrosomonadaceae bacterium]